MRPAIPILLAVLMLFTGVAQTPVKASLDMDGPGPGLVPLHSRLPTVPPIDVQETIAHIVNNVSAEYLEAYIQNISRFGQRPYINQSNVNSSIWLHDLLIGNGRLVAEYHNFSYNGYPLSNIVFTLPGLNTSSNRTYYIYAHMDTVMNTIGADDDTSGTVAVIEAARVLSRYDFQDTIKFLLVNAEEAGLVGAYRYVQYINSLGNENVSGGIDLDMIGYSRGILSADLRIIYTAANTWGADYLVDVNSRYKIGLTPTKILSGGGIPSDISAFYSVNYPSVFCIENDWSPVYHTPADTLAYLNMTLVKRTTQMSVAALAEWARMLYVDLTVASGGLEVNGTGAIAGEPQAVNVTAANLGTLNASNAEVAFHVDGARLDSRRMDMTAGVANTTGVTWTPTSYGNHTITVSLDPGNDIKEANETNNTASVIIEVNDRPTAVLSADPMKVLTVSTVTFDGSRSMDVIGGIETYNFTFGDGNGTGWTSSPVVTHAYQDDGEYDVFLEVKDAKGVVSKRTGARITVLNRAPTASPSSDVVRTLTLVPVHFLSNATDEDGIVTVMWGFGDGYETAEPSPSHPYAKAGIYDATLFIEDDDGASVAYHLTVIVDDRPPICSIDTTSTIGDIRTAFALTANATDMDGTIQQYLWDLGDGTTSMEANVVHTYAKPGDYAVALFVTDDDGSGAWAGKGITIIDNPPEAVANSRTNDIETFEPVGFSAKGSIDIEGPITYEWDFGDGNSSTVPDPEHAYERTGRYTVTLMVRDTAGQSDNVLLPQIKVRNRIPDAEFRKFGNFTENGTVYFDATNSSDPEGPVTYKWDFGDGTTGSGPVVDHVFPKASNYTVTLTVTDMDGDMDQVTGLVTVKTLPPPQIIPVTPPQDDRDTNGTKTMNIPTNMLLGMNLLLLVLFFVVLAWGLSRRPRDKVPSAPGPGNGPVP